MQRYKIPFFCIFAGQKNNFSEVKRLIPILFSILVIAGCENQAYDLDRLDKEVTLFEDGIAVPLGNVGPFTLELATKSEKINAIIGSLLKTESDGTIVCKASEEFYRLSVYEVIAKTGNPSRPFTYKLGDISTNPSTSSGLLTAIGFSSTDQSITMEINNPLSEAYAIGGSAYYACQNVRSFETTFEETKILDGKEIPQGYGKVRFLDESIPQTVPDAVSAMELRDFSFELPGDLMNKIRSSSSSEFVFSSSCTGHIAAGDRLDFDVSSLLGRISVNFKLPLGAYYLKDAEVSFELENTAPMQLTLSDVKLLTGEKSEEDPNLEITPGTLVINGGSLEKPGVTQVTLRIKSADGSIPDITGLKLGLKLSSAPGYEKTLLSMKQGISVKSASGTLRGGITFGSNE